MTFGTVTGWGPLEVFSLTLVPRGTDCPAVGLCATTVPAGLSEWTGYSEESSPAARSWSAALDFDSPTTLGTTTFATPRETYRMTVLPFGSRWPPSGFW